MLDLWQMVEAKQNIPALPGAPAKALFAEILALVGHPAAQPDIEALLSRCRLAESFLAAPGKDKVISFIASAEELIISVTSFVGINHPLPVHGEFLRRAARRSQRKSRTKIFTTNYDRCFEEAGRQGRYVVVDGFSQTFPPTFDAINFTYETVRRVVDTEAFDPIPNSFHLYKLHGSVDWQRQVTGEITKWVIGGKPVLIYPRNSKYELAFEQPYLEMISALQSSLRESNTGLLVVGFGFNDSHLAEPIMSAVRSNLSMKIVVVSPALASAPTEIPPYQGECDRNKYLGRLRDLSNAGDARITLINCGFDRMVSLVPDVAAETDLERHITRLRNVGAV